MMHIRNQKKLACMVWVTTALASMMTLAGGVQGMDIAAQVINQKDALLKQRETEKRQLETKLTAQQVETHSLKEKLMKVDEAKKGLEQEKTSLKHHINKIKEMTGGSGRNTPIVERVHKLREKSETADLVEQQLAHIPGQNLPDKIGSIQVALEDTVIESALVGTVATLPAREVGYYY